MIPLPTHVTTLRIGRDPALTSGLVTWSCSPLLESRGMSERPRRFRAVLCRIRRTRARPGRFWVVFHLSGVDKDVLRSINCGGS